MTQSPTSPTATDYARARVRELRDARGWSARQLAERLEELGVPWDRDIVANFENGRRASLSVEEMLALAIALETSPIYLLFPVDGVVDVPGEHRGKPSERRDFARVWKVRRWFRGLTPLWDYEDYEGLGFWDQLDPKLVAEVREIDVTEAEIASRYGAMRKEMADLMAAMDAVGVARGWTEPKRKGKK